VKHVRNVSKTYTFFTMATIDDEKVGRPVDYISRAGNDGD